MLLASAPYLFWLTIGLAATLSSPSSQVTAPSPAAPVTTQSEPVPPPAARASTPTVDVAEPEAVIKTTTVKVTKIVDGDTIWVEMPDGTTEKVRFIGVDSPEPTNQVQPFGEEASAYTADALSGKTIFLETDAELRDKYDRLLAHVWLALPDAINDAEVRDHLFNARLLLAGYASLLTIPPDVKYVDYLKGYEAEARTASIGLWAPAPVPPPAPAAVAPVAPAPPAPPTSNGGYIANSNTRKFHHSYCSSVDAMNPSHRVPYDTRDQAVAAGYIPCKRCNP